MAEVVPLERRYDAYLRRLGRSRPGAEAVEVRWLLEELRMSVFAQPLGVGERVSAAHGSASASPPSAPDAARPLDLGKIRVDI